MPDSAVTLLQGDVLAVLKTLPDESVDCVCTSPPYWGLRDYGTGEWEGGDPECEHARPTTNMNVGFNERWGQGAGERKQERSSSGQYAGACPNCGAVRVDDQLGLEPTPGEYVAKMVGVFREIRRVLCPHGTVWLNLGDSYVSQPSGSLDGSTLTKGGKQGDQSRRARGQVIDSKRYGVGEGTAVRPPAVVGLKAKDMVGIPWRVAFALQDDGWWLRSDIVWAKPNPMPSSVTDRPTTSHEYVFLLTKSARYFYDGFAIREPAAWERWGDQTNDKHEGSESAVGWMPSRTRAELATIKTKRPDGWASHEGSHGSVHREGREKGAAADLEVAAGRNARTVWTIPTQPFPAAHFATFPEELARRCVVAGCALEVCTNCGRPRERLIDVDYENPGNRTTNGPRSSDRKHLEFGTAGYSVRLERRDEMVGWSDCGCAYGLEPDATELIETPVGEGGGGDRSLELGRAGFERERADDEGVRLITRYEQRQYAAQLKASPARPQLEAELGETAFAHYIRSDRAGARPLPADLLDRLFEEGVLERVSFPERIGTTYRRGVVLDPFVGSGTVMVVAKREERDGVGIDLSPDYLELAHMRLTKWWRSPARAAAPKQMPGQTSMDELLVD